MTRKILVMGCRDMVGSALLARLMEMEGVEITTTEELHHRWSSERGIANLEDIARRLEKATEDNRLMAGLPSYWDNFIEMRDQQIYHQTRIPPKKAVCSSRHKGRRFKG